MFRDSQFAILQTVPPPRREASGAGVSLPVSNTPGDHAGTHGESDYSHELRLPFSLQLPAPPSGQSIFSL